MKPRINPFAEHEPEKRRAQPNGPLVISAPEREKQYYRLILEAMADIDDGRVIDHKKMQDWAESLGTQSPLPPPEVL